MKSILFVCAVLVTVCCGCSDSRDSICAPVETPVEKPAVRVSLYFVSATDGGAVKNTAVLRYCNFKLGDRLIVVTADNEEMFSHRFDIAVHSILVDVVIDTVETYTAVSPGMAAVSDLQQQIQHRCQIDQRRSPTFVTSNNEYAWPISESQL